MKYINLSLICLLILIFFIVFCLNYKEGLKGRKGNKFRRKRNSRRNRSGRRKWYGQRYGYRYSPPPRFRLPFFYNPFNVPIYNSPIYNLPYANSYRNPFIYISQFCPTGCSNLGKGRWGCTNPGYGSNDCQFASDCAICGY